MYAFKFKMNPLICASGIFGDSSSSSSSTAVMRYAPYIEEDHKEFLDTIVARRDVAIDESPYNDQTDIIVEEAFFGANYIISDFPSMYDMFGKFMAGLDIDHLYAQVFEDTVNSPEINNVVTAESDLMQDEIEMRVLPAFELQARDINSVMSSVFVTESLAIAADAKVKALNRFSAELKYRMVPVAVQRWSAHLNWNNQVIAQYTKVMQLYFASRMDVTAFNTNMDAKDTLWPFTVLEYQRAALGALQGAKSTTQTGSSDDGGGFLSDVLGIASAVIPFF